MKTKMIITALFAALSFTSCVNLMSKQNVPQQVKHLDNEKVIKQSFALKDFHAISNAIGIDVYYTQSAAYSVSVEGTEQCIAQAKLEVTDGVLNIMNRYAHFCRRLMFMTFLLSAQWFRVSAAPAASEWFLPQACPLQRSAPGVPPPPLRFRRRAASAW